MKQFDNEFGGQTLCLRREDRLEDIPAHMRSLVLPHVEEAFADPRSVFERVATRTRLRNLASYLKKMISHDNWQLVVEDSFVLKRVTRVGFYWYHPDCYPTTLVLRAAPCENPAFAEMFDLIEATCWNRVGCAGRILPPTAFHPLTDDVVEQKTFSADSKPMIFGNDSNGDVFVYCSDGRAGMISHETGDVVEYHSLQECCEWIFEQLLVGSPPEFDWQRIKRGNDDSNGPFRLRLFRPED